MEIVRKVSVGTHSDNAFALTETMDAESGLTGFTSSTSGISIASNTARRSNVYNVTDWWVNGEGYWSSLAGWNLTGRRTMSVWLRNGGTTGVIEVYVKTTDNSLYSLAYSASSGSNYVQGGQRCWIRLGGTPASYSGTNWTRLERDLQADLEMFFPGKTIASIKGAGGWGTFSFDDLRFSNSRTEMVNVLGQGPLGQGPLGHVVSSRQRHSSGSFLPSWSHYDQVGSVIATTDESGDLAERRFADAFGNRIDVFTGLWATESGLGHNTKETDGNTGLVYMYQRWYSSKTGTFLSVAPYPPMMEHEYGFAENAPLGKVDPMGMFIGEIVAILRSPCAISYALTRQNSIYDHIGYESNNFDKLGHCQMACEMERACGVDSSRIMNGTEIIPILFDPLDSFGDLSANKVGREVACDKSKSCAEKCREANLSGRLPRNAVEGFISGIVEGVIDGIISQ